MRKIDIDQVLDVLVNVSDISGSRSELVDLILDERKDSQLEAAVKRMVDQWEDDERMNYWKNKNLQEAEIKARRFIEKHLAAYL